MEVQVILVTGVIEREIRENKRGRKFSKMIQEAFLELKDMSLYIESTHENLAAKNCKRFIHSRHRAAETKGKKKS